MSKSTLFWDHPIEQLQEALDLRKQIEVLQKRLSNLATGAVKILTPKSDGRKKKRSAATIAKMKAAQQARWAHLKGDNASAKKKATAVKKSKPARGKGRNLTPEGRARLAANMKARWAAKKAAGK